MGKLKNPKDEALAQTFVFDEKARFNKTRTYLKINPKSSYDNARSYAPEVLAKSSVKNRIQELMEQANLGIDRFNGKLNELLDAKSEDVQFKSMRLGYELHGALDKEKNDDSSRDILIQVNIIGRNGEESSVTI